MADFSLEIISGKAFDKDEYSVESMMQLDAKVSRFFMYFHAVENAQIRKDGKWEQAAVYISGSHRYVKYRLLKGNEKSGTTADFYLYPEKEYTCLDYKGKAFGLETDAEKHILKLADLEILCPKSRDFNIAVFSMQVADRFLKNGKALYTQRNLDGLQPYVWDEHAKRMGIQLDENKLIYFTMGNMSFIVHDEYADALELGIIGRAEVRLQKKGTAAKPILTTISNLKLQPELCEIALTNAFAGTVMNYQYQGLDRNTLDHPIYFYLDKGAALLGNAEKKTLFYSFSAYGRRGIEMHFVTEADYYSMGNFLSAVIAAYGGKTVAKDGTINGTLADMEAKAKKEEPEVSPLEELNSLVGMKQLKEDVQELISLVRMQKTREEKGLKTVPVTLHLVFTGNPGTGKTTVARILGKLYKEIGALSKGQLVECDRSGLVAGYIGHTAIQTQKKIDEAMGGILFIDEAYTLAKEGNDFGQEAIDTLLKAMEDHRKDFVVIVAGYPDLMQKFINSNPGLKSRFNKYMNFPDYSAEELIQIFESNCKKYDYKMDEEAKAAVYGRIETMVAEKDENFANAREVRNLFETIITNQASRVDKMSEPTDEDIVMITKADVDAN